MGWAFGENNNGREIGYGVKAYCDWPGCEAAIDRGQAYICGGLDGVGNAGMEDEPYCGDFFCYEHLTFVPDAHPDRKAARDTISKAVARGKIVRPSECERCGVTTEVEGHHADYSKRYDVEWLCKRCHEDEHHGVRDG